MRLSLTNLVCVLFDPAIPTSSFNFIQLFLYLSYFGVQLSRIALFRKLNLDLLIAGRTAPCHSWKNPVERIMSIELG